MVYGEKTDGGGMLAKAIILQNNALALYKSNNMDKAICASAVARKYAADLVKSIKGTINEAYLINKDEKALITNCATDDILYIESKTFANNPSEADKDYIDSLHNLIIDLN